MKIKIIISFTLLILGLIKVIDWIVFSVKPANESLDWDAFKAKYREHLPEWLQPLYSSPRLVTGIFFFVFLAAGIIFLKAGKEYKLYFGLAVFSFFLSFWMLFSLM